MEGLRRDRNILEALGPGGVITSFEKHGETNWSTGYKVTVLKENQVHYFFLKLTTRDSAADMARGECESATALYQCIPEHACPGLGWGTLESNPAHAFFVTEYRNLKQGPVEPEDLVPPGKLAKMMQEIHSRTSPNDQFGFDVPTFRGYVRIDNSWCKTWEEYFTRMFKNDILWEQSIRGEDPEFNEVAGKFFDKVVPRLLRPLETGGRKIEPVLVHGDLWDENIAFDGDTPVIFDACCYYGHREIELAMMNTTRYRMRSEYIDAYTRLVGKSEPQEDFEDRLAIYTMCQDIVVAGLWPRQAHLRGEVKKQMEELLAKYPNGVEDLPHEQSGAENREEIEEM